MKNKDVLELLEFIEKQTNITKHEIEGWNVWASIRIRIAFDLANPRNEEVRKERVRSVLKKPSTLTKYLSSFLTFLTLPSPKKPPDILVRTSSDVRRDFIEGKWKCIHFDDIIEKSKDISYYVMEELGYNNERLEPTYIPVDFYFEGVKLYARYMPISIDKESVRKIQHEILTTLYTLLEKYPHKDGIVKVINFFEKKFEEKYTLFLKTKYAYKKLFAKIRPKILLFTCSYGFEAMTAAAKELNISVVEVQHGLIHRYHPGYMYGKHLSHYKKSFPIPDYILTYSDTYTDMLLRHSCFEKYQIRTVGNPRIEYWKNSIPSDKPTHSALVAMGGYHPMKIVTLIEETALLLAKKNISFTIKVRAHPGDEEGTERLQEIQKQFPEHIEIISGTTPNLYKYILESDFHTTIFSSTHYESITLGRPTAVIGQEGWENVAELVEQKIAPLILSAEDFVSLIERVQKKDAYYRRWYHNTYKVQEKYHKEHAIKNTIAVLHSILTMTSMKMPPEDLLDRMSILKLKMDATDNQEIQKEFKTYKDAIEEYKKQGVPIDDTWFPQLYEANKEQWEIMVEIDNVKKETNDIARIGKLYIDAEISNRKRVAIKNEIVEKTGTGFKDISMN